MQQGRFVRVGVANFSDWEGGLGFFESDPSEDKHSLQSDWAVGSHWLLALLSLMDRLGFFHDHLFIVLA